MENKTSVIKRLIDKINNNKKVFRFTLFAVSFLIVVTFGLIILKSENDGMDNTGIFNVYYRTYTDKNGWTKWSKNGLTSGNKKNEIKNIEVKIKKYDNDNIIFKTYSNNKWSDYILSGSNKKNASIYGISVMTTNDMKEKYEVCYRSYNTMNGWLEWSCNDITNGNKNIPMTAIEIKVIPRNSIYKDYLKDFNTTNNKPSIGF